MQSGELTVIGSDSIQIDLQSKAHPLKIECVFKHKHHIVPCNTHHADDLQWSCSQGSNGNYILTLSWDTGSDRDIIWAAYW